MPPGCLQSHCSHAYSRVLPHPQTQELKAGSSCHRGDWHGSRKISPPLYQRVCRVSESRPVSECFFRKDRNWCPVHFENWQNCMTAEAALPLIFQKHLCWGSMYLHICEPMGHGTVKMLAGQDYTRCLSTVLLKKAKSLILLKDLCRICCHGDW